MLALVGRQGRHHTNEDLLGFPFVTERQSQGHKTKRVSTTVCHTSKGFAELSCLCACVFHWCRKQVKEVKQETKSFPQTKA